MSHTLGVVILFRTFSEPVNRGSAIARIAGHNAKKHSNLFEEEVKIWVFEEEVSSISPEHLLS
jgi:hypothetical protein